MIQFSALINEWHDLMCLDADAASLAEHGITFVQEKRILDLTARYIRKLEAMQGDTDSQTSEFAKRVLQSEALNGQDPDLVWTICDRFLTSVGMTFRSEIPKEVPRSERRKARQLVIDWSYGNEQASWPDIGVSFPLDESLSFCAKHFAGASDAVEEVLTRQLLSDLNEGIVKIPRLTLVSRDDLRSVFTWEKPMVVLDEDSEGEGPDGETESAGAMSSPILLYFQDCIQESQLRLDEILAQSESSEDPHVQTQYAITKVEISDDDEVFRRADHLIQATHEYSGMTRAELLPIFSSAAYWGVSESIPRKNAEITNRRAKVMKSFNALRARELAFEE